MTIDKSSKLITKNWLLIIILVFAAILRLWQLGIIPPHLTPDEASLGYNAYSILKTGRDEYGELLPIVFRSFGDFKPGLYIYLTTPFVAILGLTELAVRLPSALAGILAVWLIYAISKQLYIRKASKKFIFKNAEKLALFGALLLAINPWHIHFSRGAWEVNLALTFTLAGIYFFLRELDKPKKLYWPALFFALTLLTYQGAKLSTAIVVGILIFVYWKDLINVEKRNYIRPIILGILVALPIFVSLFQGKTGRLEVFSVFSYPRPQEYIQSILDQGNETIGDINYYVFHPESLNFKRGVLGRWFNHYSGRFLFFEGDWQNPRHSAPNHGMLLLADLVILIAGLFVILKRKSKATLFILMWLVLAPLPAALSRDQVHAVRSLNMLIPLVMISSFGLMGIINWLKKFPTFRFFGYTALFILYFASFIYFLDAYFVHQPIKNAKYWHYGYKQAVQEVAKVQSEYEKIVFQQSYTQPYIYFLFFTQYDPVTYQKKANLVVNNIDVGLVEKLDNISFEFVSWPKVAEPGTLIVGDNIAIPSDFSLADYELISEIKDPGGIETSFRILEVK